MSIAEQMLILAEMLPELRDICTCKTGKIEIFSATEKIYKGLKRRLKLQGVEAPHWIEHPLCQGRSWLPVLYHMEVVAKAIDPYFFESTKTGERFGATIMVLLPKFPYNFSSHAEANDLDEAFLTACIEIGRYREKSNCNRRLKE